MSEIRLDDMYIALMGMTGAGKSSFVGLCADKKPKIGHDLESCTDSVDLYSFLYPGPPARNVFLVDTPGFDDSNRTDTEVLRELGTWLAASYSNKVQLSGIIYLHRINDTRMRGSAKRNLRLFKQLCGEENLQNVVLATTMWDLVDEETGKNREAKLKEELDYWGYMCLRGSQVFRHMNTGESAMKIIKHFIEKDSKVTLRIQEEMIRDKISFDKTAAAQQIEEELLKDRARFEQKLKEVQLEREEALREKDREAADALREVRDDYRKEIESLKQQQENFRLMQKFYEEKFSQFEEKLLGQQKERARSNEVNLPLRRARLEGISMPLRRDQHQLSSRATRHWTSNTKNTVIRWNPNDCSRELKLVNNYIVTYNGPPNASPSDGRGWIVRAMPRLNGVFQFNYFEVRIKDGGRFNIVCIGVSDAHVPLNSQVGWLGRAIGYHGDDGCLYKNDEGSEQFQFGPRFSTGDVVGCGLTPRAGKQKTVYFTLNGRLVGFTDLTHMGYRIRKVFPTVGLKGAGTTIEANFGKSPFVFKFAHEPREAPYIPPPQTIGTSVPSIPSATIRSGYSGWIFRRKKRN